MGGILDFGRTKIRKGLRLTGLQEDTDQEILKRKSVNKVSKSDSETIPQEDQVVIFY